MSIADVRPTISSFQRAPLSLERSLSRINELLVRRGHADAWWSALLRAVDELAAAVEVNRAESVGREGLHSQILDLQPRLAFDVRGLERDHVELAADIAELRSIVATSSEHPGGMPATLAATTEVVARIRGHQRRLSTVLHEAYQRDLGESG